MFDPEYIEREKFKKLITCEQIGSFFRAQGSHGTQRPVCFYDLWASLILWGSKVFKVLVKP
jgi:hypothetical protein